MKKIAIATGIFFVVMAAAVWFFRGLDIAVLHPAGMIAEKQRSLIYISTLLMLIVVIPVFILATVIAWKYRRGNKKASYTPNWDNNILAECIWWGFPLVIIVILSVVVWKSSHELDPFKPLDSHVKPLTIQVVALQWKWLFIYPEHNIATVNFVQFPEKTPLNFEITADAPMNSFWIPKLGGQIYAMSGMKTKLHLIANEVGSFRGSSANLSGEGFAGMTFTAEASEASAFDSWVRSIQKSAPPLSLKSYHQLAKPSSNTPVAFYKLQDSDLFEQIVRQ